ncbi:Cell cycle checkpoint protein rad17 [Ceratobasidium sp. 414]|nr:Cell cycle checkpoint protein rad17 [Ceratobasidium sp. 414]
MARKAAPSPTRPIRKNKLKRSTLSSDSLFGASSAGSSARQLSIPRFNLSQNSPTQAQVIDLTGDDTDDASSSRRTPIPVPIPVRAHVAKRPRRTSPSPSPLGGVPAKVKAMKIDQKGGGEDRAEGLWVDLHTPTTQDTLAVHPKKVEDVRRWLNEAVTGGPTGKLRRYRRMLVLTGPSGCGKTATLRVLANELEAEVVEWYASSDEFSMGGDYDYESAVTKLVAFLDRAGSYSSLALSNAIDQPQPSSSTATPVNAAAKKPKILLLEDLPSLSHPRIKSTFHSALVRFAETFSAQHPAPPLVIIISDAGLRADESGPSYSYERADILDIRSVLPPALLSSHYVTQIKFNPIAATFMRKALSNIISSRLSLPVTSKSGGVPRETLDTLVEASAGDIRSAIMAVQFACVVGGGSEGKVQANGGGKGRGKGKGKSERDATVKAMCVFSLLWYFEGALMEGRRFAAVTRREQALALFHLLGRLFYNKRSYGDPDEPGEVPRQTARGLPEHLAHFERRPSKVDVAALHADSPVDASLFTLYVQQNFPQFCDEIDECWGLADALSEADGGMGVLDDGPTMSSALAHHAFQHVARSALVSLPSPVPRRSQVMRKPAWFAARAKERDAESAVEDAKRWLNEHGGGGGGWNRKSIVLDAGSVLNRLGAKGPPSAQLFCAFRWETSTVLGDALGEEEAVEAGVDMNAEDVDDLEERAARVGKVEQKQEEKGYLSDDDIDEF